MKKLSAALTAFACLAPLTGATTAAQAEQTVHTQTAPNSFETGSYSTYSQQHWHPAITYTKNDDLSNDTTVMLDISYELRFGTYRRHPDSLFHRIETVQQSHILDTTTQNYATQFPIAREIYNALTQRLGSPEITIVDDRRITSPETAEPAHFTGAYMRMDSVTNRISNQLFDACRAQTPVPQCTL